MSVEIHKYDLKRKPVMQKLFLSIYRGYSISKFYTIYRRVSSMFETVFKKVEEETSGVTARIYNTYIAQFHRVQASPGLREAANYCVDVFKRNGIENAKVLSYPATDETRYWHYKLFQEWAIEDAELDLTHQQRQ